ncbi:MAG: YkgJ family cysteine cluster protein [Planctomycetota bacterium]|nr:MAG: YkgJ family cysteine cluster protein [Planctomycetota bacterium]REK25050.1 MAG: YkgJ family cysteine cluster protein [Planctomycetota bacterium]REK28115.1 MAG: YkgJ family cysteine cluster protein [Planctomycetota bacterium]
MDTPRLQVIDQDANFSCGACSLCCQQPYAILMEKEKLAALDEHGFPAHPRLQNRKLYHESKDAPEGYVVLEKKEGTTHCVFLGDDGLCIIHKELGADAKPRGCSKFPYSISPTFVEDRISLDFGCPTVQADEGRPLAEQKDDIARTCRIANAGVYPDATVRLGGGISVPHAEYEALMDDIRDIFAAEEGGLIWSRFDRTLTLLERIMEEKRPRFSDEDAETVDDAHAESDAASKAGLAPFDSAPAAPSPVRMMFASTLLRDVLPPSVHLNLSVWRRVLLLPKLMKIAKLTGEYDSKLLGRKVDIDAVLAHPLEGGLKKDASALLRRCIATRMWQRLLAGTRLPVVAGVHQHIQDVNAALFLARAEAHHRGADTLTRELVGKGLSLVEFNITNQPRLFNQKSLSWFTGQLDDPALARQSLRLMALPGSVTRPTEIDAEAVRESLGEPVAPVVG